MKCSRELYEEVQAYPRTCEVCAHGPCTRGQKLIPGPDRIPSYQEKLDEFNASAESGLQRLRAKLIERIEAGFKSSHETLDGFAVATSIPTPTVQTELAKEFKSQGWLLEFVSDQRDGTFISIRPAR